MSVILRKFKVSALLVIAGVVLVAASVAADAAITFEHKLVPEDPHEQMMAYGSVGISGNLILASTYDIFPIDGVPRGGVYLFDLNSGDQLHKLLPVNAGGLFGARAAISGTTVIAYEHPDLGSYLFDATTGQQTFKLTETYSGSVAIDGVRAVVTDPYMAAAWVFDTTTGVPTASFSVGDLLWGVDLDGNIGVIGGTGVAYTFDITTGTQLATLQPAQPIAYPVVAISGSTALVGDYQQNEAYIFDAITGVQSATLLPDVSTLDSYFGVAVAIDGNLALVGAFGDDTNGANAGAAYLFDISTGAQLAKILAPDGATGDVFGISVALEGNTAVIGASGANGGSGAVYVFTIPEPASLVVLVLGGFGLVGRGRALSL
jgi:hypothetical protein